MKPINNQIRINHFFKFLASGIALMSLFGFSIYSYALADKNIKYSVTSHNSDVDKLLSFISQNDSLVVLMDKSSTPTDRQRFKTEIQKNLVDNKSSFASLSDLYNKVDNQYQTILKKDDVVGKVPDEVEKIKEEMKLAHQAELDACQAKIDAEKEKSDELKDKISEMRSSGSSSASRLASEESDKRRVKASLTKISSSLQNIADEIMSTDWCGAIGGSGKGDVKSKMKGKINEVKNDVIQQSHEL